MEYNSTWESVRQHPVPEWFHDAKLGIFVHWGLYSVPGWAVTGHDPKQHLRDSGWREHFAHNSYAEWYLNSLRVGSSPTRWYHAETYGPEFDYDDFVPIFNAETATWDPDEWASLFQRARARYVVLTTKHHDGFLLWPSNHPNPHKENYVARRDIVGDLTSAVRSKGMRMGLYYSGGLDWSFEPRPIQDIVDLFSTIPQGRDYTAYALAHWRELIERYKPVVLWNDIGFPARAHLPALFANYYNWIPTGVINDRFLQLYTGPGLRLVKWLLALAPVRASMGEYARRAFLSDRPAAIPSGRHCDYTTPEYVSYNAIVEKKWEATRGIGHSFGYNRVETVEDYLSAEELIRSFVDIVSKNGNLLLNVGPMADGTVPGVQHERLLQLGQWLDVNGEAIFDTRPWVTAEGACETEGGTIPLRFTRNESALYATLMTTPTSRQVELAHLRARQGTTVHLLGCVGPLRWAQQDNGLSVTLPDTLPGSIAHSLRISPQPTMGDN
jgi:alpha-L-fucosidase